jgi:FtsZ-binding cell division protein ZapB
MPGTEILSLEVLEEKINRAASLINALRKEKNEVELANKELKEKMQTLYIKNEELTQQLEALKRQREKRGSFDKAREEIGNKIEEMLAKLEGLDI